MEQAIKKFAILGHPLDHSLSPLIHRTAFQFLKLPYTYEKIDIAPDQLDIKIRELQVKKFSGFNITVPYKSQILPYLDEMDSIAGKIGAVNTVKLESDGTWRGSNTDYVGFLKALPNRGEDIRSTLIIGAGGAARAVVFGVSSLLSVDRLVVVNRTRERAEELISDVQKYQPNISVRAHAFEDKMSEPFDLIVNASTLGLAGIEYPFPINPAQLSHQKTVVYDLIYKEQKTSFLEMASEANLKTINGWPMLIYQAEEAFKIWTGRNFPDAVLQDLLSRY